MDLTPKYGFQKPVLDDLNWHVPTNENWDLTELLISGTDALASGTQVALAAHIIDTNDAHPATAVSYDNITSGLAALNAQDALDELKDITDQIDTDLTTNYSPNTHNHDANYAPLVHDHSGTYSPLGHNHDGTYAPLSLSADVAALSGTVVSLASDVAGKEDALGFTPENSANKGVANGYASLDSNGLVPVAQLPSDAFTGVQSVNGLSGTAVSLDTDDVLEGSTNLYWTDTRFDNRLAASAVDAETLDGLNSSDFATASHNHDGAYAALGHNHDASYAPLSLVADVAVISGTVASHTADIAQLESDVAGKQNALGYTAENQANRGVAGGYAPLGLDGKVPVSNLPAIAINETFVVTSQAEMIALTAERGDVAVRTDINKSFILKTDDPTLVANWQELLTPTDAVTTVNGQSGNVVLGAINIDTTTSGNVSGTIQNALVELDTRITGAESDIAGKQNTLGFTPEDSSNKGVANGYASLGVDGLVPVSQLPASATGGVQSVNGLSGTTINLTTDEIPEGSTNLYWTQTRFDNALGAATIDADTLDGLNSTNFAAANHNHDGVYAGVVHNHNGVYSPIGHDHDTVYRKKTDTAYVEMFAVADLASLTAGQVMDYKVISGGAKNISKVVISSLTTPGSGGIEIDIKIKATPASVATSIFTTTPVLTGNGGINWMTVTTGFDTNTIPDDAMVILEIVSANGGDDLRVEIYE